MCADGSSTRPRGVIFDLDGTLLDTLGDLAEAVNAALRSGGFPTHPIDAYRLLVGDGVRVLAERALPENHRDPRTIESLLARFEEEYARGWDATTCPYPGIPELLEALSLRGIPTAVLSNKPHDLTLLNVRRLLPRSNFVSIAGARPGVPLKPHAAGALALAVALGLPPEGILFVGDSSIDMHTARSAGMTPVGVLWGFRSEAELREAGAAALIVHPRELLELFDRLFFPG